MCSIVLATSPVRWYLISVCGLERKALVRGVKLLSVGWIVNQSIHKFNRSANGAVSVAVKYIRLKRSYYTMSSMYPLCRLVPNYLNLGIKEQHQRVPTLLDHSRSMSSSHVGGEKRSCPSLGGNFPGGINRQKGGRREGVYAAEDDGCWWCKTRQSGANCDISSMMHLYMLDRSSHWRPVAVWPTSHRVYVFRTSAVHWRFNGKMDINHTSL